MADKKVSELSAITNLSGDDLLLVVNDPSGTPTSNKVTVSNLFANVVPNVVHKGTVTARANTTFTGTTMTVSSNATFSGTLTASIGKYLEVANATATLVSNTNFQSYVANTNSQIATLVSNTNFQSYVANTNASINDRLQVANASLNLTSNSVTVSSNTGFRITGKASDPATSNAAYEGILAGSIFYSNTHLYVATDDNTIQRVALSTF